MIRIPRASGRSCWVATLSMAPRHTRAEAGQALVEGSVMLVVLILFFVGCLLLLINGTVVSGYDYKLRVIAQAAAEYMTQERYYMGFERRVREISDSDPDFVATKAAALELTNGMLRSVHLPACSPADFKVEPVNTTLSVYGPRGGERTRPLTMYHVTIKLERLPLVGQLFPFVGLSAEGISAENSTPPYAAARLHFHDPSGLHRAITFPAFYASSAQPDSTGKPVPTSNRSVYLKRGYFTGPYPVAYMPLKVDLGRFKASVALVEPDDTYAVDGNERGAWEW